MIANWALLPRTAFMALNLITLVAASGATALELEADAADPEGETDATLVAADPQAVMASDGVTALESWMPLYATDVVAATACHQITGDWYGIAVVFTVWSAPPPYPTWRNEVWYLVVDGWSPSSSPGYGKLASARKLGSHSGIRHIDCASDGASAVFVSWDRVALTGVERLPARLARVTIDGSGQSTTTWSVDVGSQCLHPSTERPVYASRPRVAWTPAWSGHPGGSLTIATNEFTEALGEATGSGQCFVTHDAATGAYITASAPWLYPGCHAIDWDVEWNGLNAFVGVVKFTPDDVYAPRYGSVLMNRDGTFTNTQHELVPAGDPTMPTGVELAFTPDSTRNPFQRLLGLTDRNAYWIRQDGTLRGAVLNYLTPRDHFHACEYWGPTATSRIAHSYAEIDAVPPTIPNRTRHDHWPTSPGGPYEDYDLNDEYWPLACSSSDTVTDPEVLLVSERAAGGATVYWNIEPED